MYIPRKHVYVEICVYRGIQYVWRHVYIGVHLNFVWSYMKDFPKLRKTTSNNKSLQSVTLTGLYNVLRKTIEGCIFRFNSISNIQYN